MGILIQFPQRDTRTAAERPSTIHSEAREVRLAAAYRRDLDRAVAILLEHVQTDEYDGVALILKPTSTAHRPALVVGGFYRHRLTEGASAAMQLHLSLKIRAHEQASQLQARDARDGTTPTPIGETD